MSLRDRLTEDLKLAMKSRDQLRMDVIRMVKAAIMNKEMELKDDFYKWMSLGIATPLVCVMIATMGQYMEHLSVFEQQWSRLARELEEEYMHFAFTVGPFGANQAISFSTEPFTWTVGLVIKHRMNPADNSQSLQHVANQVNFVPREESPGTPARAVVDDHADAEDSSDGGMRNEMRALLDFE